MCYSKIGQEQIKKMRTSLHTNIDTFCDKLEKASGDEQDELALEELVHNVEEDMLDTVDDFCQNNNQESTPLLYEEQQELRCRVRRPTLENEGPGDRQPEESFYDRVLRCFQRLLQRLKKIWQDVLTWVKEKTALLCSAVKAVWNAVMSFFSSVEQNFLSPLQA